VANLSLTAESPLNGFEQRFGTTSVAELNNVFLFSVALSLNAEAGKKAVNAAFGTDWPAPGKISSSSDGKSHLLGLQADQIFALQTDVGDQHSTLAEPTIESAYVTDQSDSWAALSINGDRARDALERICPIDLHPNVFGKGSVTRTSMEHLAVIIACVEENHYWLLSPTSSAKSFLHAVETSFNNIG